MTKYEFIRKWKFRVTYNGFDHEVRDCEKELIADLELLNSMKCQCNNELKTGQTSVMCCNICGKPDEKFWSNKEIEDDKMKCLGH